MASKPEKPEKKAPARPRRTKADTQSAFESLAAEVAERESVDAKTSASIRANELDVRAEVEGVGVEDVVARISGLGLDVSRALADLAEKLTAEVRLLATLREAVAIERRELERLHQIDVAAASIDQLVEEHGEKKAELEHEIEGARTAWESDTARLERERREQEDALKKQRQREIEDYEYRKTLERKKAQDKYEEESRLTERRNAERQESLEKDWLRREATLKEREEHVARLQGEVADFPARLARETEVASAEARRQVEAQLERQILLLKKDAEAEARVSELRIKALDQSIAAGSIQIAALERQLSEAKQQVQDIAVRAIEGASGARALTHINQIAMEQAKNRPQG